MKTVSIPQVEGAIQKLRMGDFRPFPILLALEPFSLESLPILEARVTVWEFNGWKTGYENLTQQ